MFIIITFNKLYTNTFKQLIDITKTYTKLSSYISKHYQLIHFSAIPFSKCYTASCHSSHSAFRFISTIQVRRESSTTTHHCILKNTQYLFYSDVYRTQLTLYANPQKAKNIIKPAWEICLWFKTWKQSKLTCLTSTIAFSLGYYFAMTHLVIQPLWTWQQTTSAE